LRFYRPDEEAVQEGGGGNVVAYHHPDKDVGSRGNMNEEVEEAGRRTAPRRRSDIDQGETGRLIDIDEGWRTKPLDNKKEKKRFGLWWD
jgi:hypothetical protein